MASEQSSANEVALETINLYTYLVVARSKPPAGLEPDLLRIAIIRKEQELILLRNDFVSWYQLSQHRKDPSLSVYNQKAKIIIAIMECHNRRLFFESTWTAMESQLDRERVRVMQDQQHGFSDNTRSLWDRLRSTVDQCRLWRSYMVEERLLGPDSLQPPVWRSNQSAEINGE